MQARLEHVDEFVRTQPRQLLIERNRYDKVDAAFFYEPQPVLKARDVLRLEVPAKRGVGVVLEGKDSRELSGLPRPIDEALHEMLVAPVDTVEDADGQDGLPILDCGG